MTDEPDVPLTRQQRIAKALRERLHERRMETGGIAGSPGTLGEGNTNNSTGQQNVTGVMKTLGLDEEPPR